MDTEKRARLANGLWHWIGDKLLETQYTSRLGNYQSWFRKYRGQQWDDESNATRIHATYRPVHNEMRRSMEDHVAQIISSAPRHYFVNVDANIIEQLALNAFMVRATRGNMYVARRNALLYGLIYGTAVMSVSLNAFAKPSGYVPAVSIGDTEGTLPMPQYQADPPWQWVIDPSANGADITPTYAIRFFIMNKTAAKRLTGKNVLDAGGTECMEVMQQFTSKQDATSNIRNNGMNPNDNYVLCANIWFSGIPLGAEDKPEVAAKRELRVIQLVGNDITCLDYSPYGQDAGIPIGLFTPFPEPGYLYGMSFVQRAWDMQSDLNFRRAKARDMELFQSGVAIVKAPTMGNAEKEAARFRAQMGSGVVGIASNVVVDRIRGERVPPSLYNELVRSAYEMDRLLGVPPVLSGNNQTGVYSGRQTDLLVRAASTAMQWKHMEFGRMLEAVGQKEWAMLKYIWKSRRIMMDTGSQSVLFSTDIMDIPGWSVEVLPEMTYAQLMSSNDKMVQQLFLQGLTDPMTFYQHVPALSAEEKERTLEFLQQATAAAQSTGQTDGQPMNAGREKGA